MSESTEGSPKKVWVRNSEDEDTGSDRYDHSNFTHVSDLESLESGKKSQGLPSKIVPVVQFTTVLSDQN